MKANLVLFDIGGVLLEYRNVFTTTAKELGFNVNYLYDTFDKYDDQITLGKITPQELLELCVKEYQLPPIPQGYDFLTKWSLDFEIIMPTQAFLQKICQQYHVGLLSNIYTGMFSVFIEHGLLPNIPYSYRFLSCDIGYKKPDESIFTYIEKETSLPGAEILFIDDRQDYLTNAQQRNWQTHLFQRNSPEVSVNELKSLLL